MGSLTFHAVLEHKFSLFQTAVTSNYFVTSLVVCLCVLHNLGIFEFFLSTFVFGIFRPNAKFGSDCHVDAYVATQCLPL